MLYLCHRCVKYGLSLVHICDVCFAFCTNIVLFLAQICKVCFVSCADKLIIYENTLFPSFTDKLNMFCLWHSYVKYVVSLSQMCEECFVFITGI